MEKESRVIQILVGAAVFTFVVYWLSKILENTTEKVATPSQAAEINIDGRNS